MLKWGKMKIRKIKEKNKKGMLEEVSVYWIVAVFILIVGVGVAIFLRQKDISLLEFIENLFRFGR